jgi:hypothetical protein
LVGFDVGDNAFEVLVVADEFEGGGGADAFDGVEVVAAEKDTEVDELRMSIPSMSIEEWLHLTCSRSISKPSSTLSR